MNKGGLKSFCSFFISLRLFFIYFGKILVSLEAEFADKSVVKQFYELTKGFCLHNT